MSQLSNLPFNNSFTRLDPALYSRVKVQGLKNPVLVSANTLAAELIDLDPDQLQSTEIIDYFNGNIQLPSSDPLTMIYSGHQFGSYNPQLGDDRGLLLGEVESSKYGK